MPTEWKRTRVEFHGNVTYSDNLTVHYSYYEYVVVEETKEWVRLIAFQVNDANELKLPLSNGLTEEDCKEMAEQFAALIFSIRSK